MINKIPGQKAALVLFAIWAFIATALYINEMQSKATKSEITSSPMLADSQISFVRQFVSQYLSYDPENFRRTQTALAYSLTEPLRTERLKEIDRLEATILEKKLEQVAEVLTISDESGYLVGTATIVSGTKKLISHFRISLEAPQSQMSGSPFQVKALSFSSLEEVTPDKLEKLRLNIGMNKKMVLDFPCSVENIEHKKDDPIEIKITTLNVSELQLLAKNSFKEINLTANCKDRIFSLILVNSDSSQILYQKIGPDLGAPIAKQDGKKSKPAAYRKTLEDELGFVIEE